MVSKNNTDAAEELALARAVLYRFASELFRHPSFDQGERVDRDGARMALELFVARGADSSLCAQIERCIELARDRAAVLHDHARLLGPTPRAGATPYETEWLGAAGDLLQFHQISDIAAFYKAFGLELSTGCDERADHLSVELAFLHFLCVKEAYALEHGLVDLVEIDREAQRKFLSEHLARWAPAFCARLERMDPSGCLGRAAEFVRALLESECRRADVACGDPGLAPSETNTSLDDCCVGCHQSSSCVARATPEGARDDQA